VKKVKIFPGADRFGTINSKTKKHFLTGINTDSTTAAHRHIIEYPTIRDNTTGASDEDRGMQRWN